VLDVLRHTSLLETVQISVVDKRRVGRINITEKRISSEKNIIWPYQLFDMGTAVNNKWGKGEFNL